MKRKYVCEKCGQQYDDEVDAEECERVDIVGDDVSPGDRVLVREGKIAIVESVKVVNPGFIKKYGHPASMLHHRFIMFYYMNNGAKWQGAASGDDYKKV